MEDEGCQVMVLLLSCNSFLRVIHWHLHSGRIMNHDVLENWEHCLVGFIPSSFHLCFNCFINHRDFWQRPRLLFSRRMRDISSWCCTVMSLLPLSYSLASPLRAYNDSWCNRELRTLIDLDDNDNYYNVVFCPDNLRK